MTIYELGLIMEKKAEPGLILSSVAGSSPHTTTTNFVIVVQGESLGMRLA